jgi:hypothetical protein
MDREIGSYPEESFGTIAQHSLRILPKSMASASANAAGVYTEKDRSARDNSNIRSNIRL